MGYVNPFIYPTGIKNKRVGKNSKTSENPANKWSCIICNDVLHNKETLMDHYEQHKNEIENNTEQDAQTENMCSYFKCIICTQEFTSSHTYEKHLEQKHGENFYACDVCNKNYKNAFQLCLHNFNAHATDGEYKCIVCDFSTGVKETLRTHIQTHEKDTNYQCEVCDKNFLTSSWFEEHKNTHIGAMPFQCEICFKSFPYSRYLISHRKSQHPDMYSNVVSINKCDICDKQFAHKKSLILHIRSHTGENSVLCDVCGKSLSSSEHLRQHLRIHSGYKPHVCAICGKGFAKKSNLTLHERVHTGEKPYVCGSCGKCFSQRSTLVIHERYHSGDRPYTCQLCTKGFVSKGLLSVHIKSCSRLIDLTSDTLLNSSICNDKLAYVADSTSDVIVIDGLEVTVESVLNLEEADVPVNVTQCESTNESTSTPNEISAEKHSDAIIIVIDDNPEDVSTPNQLKEHSYAGNYKSKVEKEKELAEKRVVNNFVSKATQILKTKLNGSEPMKKPFLLVRNINELRDNEIPAVKQKKRAFISEIVPPPSTHLDLPLRVYQGAVKLQEEKESLLTEDNLLVNNMSFITENVCVNDTEVEVDEKITQNEEPVPTTVEIEIEGPENEHNFEDIEMILSDLERKKSLAQSNKEKEVNPTELLEDWNSEDEDVIITTQPQREVEIIEIDCEEDDNRDGVSTNSETIEGSNFSFECRACSHIFKNVKQRNFHELVIHNKTAESDSFIMEFKCLVCYQSFKTWNGVVSHVSKNHPKWEGKVYGCLRCKKGYTSQENHVHELLCQKCGKMCGNSIELNDHQCVENDSEKPSKQTNSSLYSCIYCTAEFDLMIKTKRHVEMKHKNIHKPFYRCNKSGIHFPVAPDEQAIYKQTVEDGVHPNADQNMDDDDDGEIYECIFCEERFTNCDSARNHMKTHGESAAHRRWSYMCVKCCKCFTSYEDTVFHVKWVHGKSKLLSYYCQFCNKKFRIYEAHSHDKAKAIITHAPIHVFNCIFCNTGCKEYGDIITHLESKHANVLEPEYRCHRCCKNYSLEEYHEHDGVVFQRGVHIKRPNKAMRRKLALLQVFTKSSTTVTNYYVTVHCDGCFTLYQNKKDEVKKITSNDVVRAESSCRKCKKRFSDVENRLHSRLFNTSVKEDFDVNIPGTSKQKISSYQNFMCFYCGCQFKNYHRILEHIKVAHKHIAEKNNPIPEETKSCVLCQKIVNKKDLFAHTKSIHPGNFCLICFEVFDKEKIHICSKLSSINMKIACPRCLRVFDFEGNYLHHKKFHEAQDVNDLRWCCFICELAFGSRDLLDRHEKRHNTFQECSVCFKKYKFPSSVEKCKLIHQNFVIN